MGAQNFANELRERPPQCLLNQAIAQHTDGLRTTERTAVQNLQEASIRAVFGLYHLAMVRGVRQVLRDLERRCLLPIRREIESWTVADPRGETATLQSELEAPRRASGGEPAERTGCSSEPGSESFCLAG